MKPREICGLHRPVQIISEFQCSKDPKSFLLQLICRRWNPDEELAHFHKQNQTDTSCLYSYTYNYNAICIYIYINTHTCGKHLKQIICKSWNVESLAMMFSGGSFTGSHLFIVLVVMLPRPGSVFGELAVIHQANCRVSFQNVQPQSFEARSELRIDADCISSPSLRKIHFATCQPLPN